MHYPTGVQTSHLLEPCCSPIPFPPAHRSTAALSRDGTHPTNTGGPTFSSYRRPNLYNGFSQILPPPPTGLEATSLLIPEKHKNSQHPTMPLKPAYREQLETITTKPSLGGSSKDKRQSISRGKRPPNLHPSQLRAPSQGAGGRAQLRALLAPLALA